MDAYDDEDAEGKVGVRGVFGNTNPGMAYYGANEEDPYIQLASVDTAESDADEYEITGEDYILLAARNEDDVSHLEACISQLQLRTRLTYRVTQQKLILAICLKCPSWRLCFLS